MFNSKKTVRYEAFSHLTVFMFKALKAIVLLDDLAVRLADLLIPEEGILAAAGEIAGAVVVAVDINEPVTLCVLARAGGDQVDRTPGRVADQVDTVFDGFLHGLYVLAEVGTGLWARFFESSVDCDRPDGLPDLSGV